MSLNVTVEHDPISSQLFFDFSHLDFSFIAGIISPQVYRQ